MMSVVGQNFASPHVTDYVRFTPINGQSADA
jgi:hypothetical protein